MKPPPTWIIEKRNLLAIIQRQNERLKEQGKEPEPLPGKARPGKSPPLFSVEFIGRERRSSRNFGRAMIGIILACIVVLVAGRWLGFPLP